MRGRFYRFAAREADFFAALFFWFGAVFVVTEGLLVTLSIVAVALGGSYRADGEIGLIGVALLALSFLLHRAQKTPGS